MSAERDGHPQPPLPLPPPANKPSRVRSLWSWLARAYESTQIELSGSYSVERMLELHDSLRSHSHSWCVLVLLATPVPCIVTVILVDAVPLNPPSKGLEHSHSFWYRVAFVIGCSTFTTLEQLRAFVPRLSRNSRLADFVMALLTGMGGSACGLLLASVVGYPLPFTLFLGTPGWQVLFWTCIWIKWGRELRHDQALRGEVAAFFRVVASQLVLIVVYPVYNYVFSRLTGTVQTAFALLLPVIKLLSKNAYHRVFHYADDFLPESVIFNIEIFHALFVATCTQNSTSSSTTAVVVLADFVQSWAHIRDVDGILSTLPRTRAVESQEPDRSKPQPTPQLHAASPLTIALMSLAIDSSLHTDNDIRFEATSSSRTRSRVDSQQLASPTHTNLAAIHPVGPRPFAETPLSAQLRRLTCTIAQQDLDQFTRELAIDERRTYVATVLRVLRTAEFLVLVEFVEVAVSLVYCVYLMAIAHMPNRVFYPDIARMDEHALWSTVGKILVYTLLELVSFVALCVVLQRRLQLSPVRQLAFVLHKQWTLVQSKMIVWVVMIVGSSLEQFGFDYTFQFAWLRAVAPH